MVCSEVVLELDRVAATGGPKAILKDAIPLINNLLSESDTVFQPPHQAWTPLPDPSPLGT
jgi:hypothetical protein